MSFHSYATCVFRISNGSSWPILPDRNPGLVLHLPSGKYTRNYGKSPFFMGKSSIHSFLYVYQRVFHMEVKPMSNIFLEIQHPFLSQLFWASPEGFARLLTCFDIGLHGVTTLDALYIYKYLDFQIYIDYLL